jgi:FlaA1/EpsC-like NDP-sugar epimerase
MGEPVRIRDLAEQMIRFYGLEPVQDIGIEYVGLRAGERLDEKLIWEFESKESTGFDRILKLARGEPEEINIQNVMEELRPICRLDASQPQKYRDSELLRSILRKHIQSYAHNSASG